MEMANDVNYWDLRMTLCGFKVKRKNGQLRLVMMRFVPIEMGEKGAVKQAVSHHYIQDLQQQHYG